MEPNINYSGAFHVGDIVTPNKRTTAAYISSYGPTNGWLGEWTVVWNSSVHDVIYIRKEANGDQLSVKAYNYDLVKAVEYKPETDKNILKVGHTVEFLATAQRQNRTFQPGQLGEIASIEFGNGGTIKVKGDWWNDATSLRREHFKVIDWHSEDDYREEARVLAKKYKRKHEHKWEYKWNNSHRFCECGVSQWNLLCWTGENWHYKTPRGIIIDRKDLDKKKYFGCQDFIEPKPKPGDMFRERSRNIISEEVLNLPIAMIGAGAIGSFTALALIKMGFKGLRVWDHDIVEEVNVGTQLYGSAYAGQSKVNALNGLIAHHIGPIYMEGSQSSVVAYPSLFDSTSPIPDGSIVIMAVDSMEARRMIWERCKRNPDVRMIIDARMGAENANLYTMNPNDAVDIESYERTLYSDAQALQEPCTAQGTVYTALLISGMIGKAVKDVMMEIPTYPRVMLWNISDNAQEIWTKPTAITPREVAI